MWKKIRDSTSGLNVNFLSGIFRRRSYSKFGSDEEIRDLHSHQHDDIRDEENNKVSWTRSINSKRLADDHNDNVFTEDGYQRAELCTTLRSVRDNRTDDGYSYQQSDSMTNYNDVTSEGYGNDQCDTRDVAPYEFYAGNSVNRPSPGNVKGEVQDFVNGYVQRRYQRLDDSDDMSVDNIECDIDSDYHSQRGSRDSDNNVFHCIKELEPKWQEKSKKNKKRKKAAKRARRAVRTTWKWMKRGFTGYSRDFAAATNFFTLSTSFGLAQKKR